MKRLGSSITTGSPEILRKKKEECSSKFDHSMRNYQNAKLAARQFEEYVNETTDSGSARPSLTEEQVDELCNASRSSPISSETKTRVYNQARKRLLLLTTRREACAVCDHAVRISDVQRCRPKGKTAERWKVRLSGRDDVPLALREHYNVTEWYPELSGALLSKAGIEISKSGQKANSLLLCGQCHASMTSATSSKPPKFSIANGFDIVLLPEELMSARSIEKRLTSMISVAHSVTVVRGGKHKVLKGHVSFMRIDPTPVATELPRLLPEVEETCLVIMAGKPPAQKILAMKRHETRIEMLRSLLDFYVSNNELYQSAGLSIDEKALHDIRDGRATGVNIVATESLEKARREKECYQEGQQAPLTGKSF